MTEGEQPIPYRPQWPQGLAPDQQYQGPPGVSSTPFQFAPYTPHQGYGNHHDGQYQAPCQQYRGPPGTASAHNPPTAYAPSQGYGNHPFGQYHIPTIPLPNMYQRFPPPTLYSGFTTPKGYPPIAPAEYQLHALDAPEHAPFPHPMPNHQFGLPNYATSAPGIALGPTPFTFAPHPAIQAPTVEARSEPVSRGHQNANGQARQDDQITRFFTELVEKKEANRAEKDRKIEERIKRLEECNKAKERESAMLKALLSHVQRRLGFANADNSAREPTAQAKSNNHPSEPVGSPMASNDTTNKGSRKRRRSIIKTESDDDHEEFDSSALGEGKKRLLINLGLIGLKTSMEI